MRLFEFAALGAWITNLTLAFFVLWQDARSSLHRAFFVWALGVAIANLGCFFLYQSPPEEIALWWARLMHLGIIITPLGLFETARILADQPRPVRILRGIFCLHLGLVLCLGTPWIVRGVHEHSFGFWPLPGLLAGVLIASYGLLTLWAAVLLWRAGKLGTPLHRLRLRAVLGAIALLVLTSANDLLPTLGFQYYPLVERAFHPMGSVAACLYMLVVAYSVLQHRLLDAQLSLSRAAAHLVRFGFLALSSICLLLAFTAVVPQQFNDISFAGAVLVQVMGALVATIFFPRLFGTGTETVERRILGDQPEYTEEVRASTYEMHACSDLNALAAALDRVLIQLFGVRSYSLHLRAVAGGFQLLRAYPTSITGLQPEIAAQSPIVRYFEGGPEVHLSRAGSRANTADEDEIEARAELAENESELGFPLRVHEEPIGFLLLGAKRSLEPFTPTDLQLLTSLVNTLALMVNQIRLTTQIHQAQEFELLGRMSSGFAHDLNNLLTPISTLLQLTTKDGQVDTELLPVAKRNTAAIRDYIREGLFFSQHQRPDFQYMKLNTILGQAIEVARNSRESNVRIETLAEEEIWAEVDAVMMQRLVANLLTNAIDASRDGARIVIGLGHHARSEEGVEWVRLRVVDEGAGIPSEDRPRVFSPYFTTKNRGDRKRGYGLGLAICRKIAALHGGELSLETESGVGTTVALDLPLRQERSDIPSIFTEGKPLPA